MGLGNPRMADRRHPGGERLRTCSGFPANHPGRRTVFDFNGDRRLRLSLSILLWAAGFVYSLRRIMEQKRSLRSEIKIIFQLNASIPWAELKRQMEIHKIEMHKEL